MGREALQKLAVFLIDQWGICGTQKPDEFTALCVGTDAQGQRVACAVGDQQVGVDRSTGHQFLVEVIVVCPAVPGRLPQGDGHTGVVLHVVGFVLMHLGCWQLERGHGLQQRSVLAILRHVVEAHAAIGLRYSVQPVVPVARVDHPVIQQGNDWINV